MNKIGLLLCAGLLALSCNNSAENTTSSDTTTAKDNTNVYDTGMGSSMTDTAQRMDTSDAANKMQDTVPKK